MKIKAIACEALTREIRLASAYSPHVIDIVFLAFGLHSTPDKLREVIQSEVDSAEGQDYDAVVLGYGLCSRGTADIRARTIPVVVPRAHDCITFFLGSRERYAREFAAHPGTYYYSPGWIERKEGDMEQGYTDVHDQMYEQRHREYIEKYGEDNAAFLIEQEKQWYANYSRAAFINMGIGDIEGYRAFTRNLADDRGWEYSELEGEMSLLVRLLNGEWESEDFLVARPGQMIIESFDPLVIKAKL